MIKIIPLFRKTKFLQISSITFIESNALEEQIEFICKYMFDLATTNTVVFIVIKKTS